MRYLSYMDGHLLKLIDSKFDSAYHFSILNSWFQFQIAIKVKPLYIENIVFVQLLKAEHKKGDDIKTFLGAAKLFK